MAIRRALTLQNIVDAKIPRFDFAGEWFEAFGRPQMGGIWFVYGGSGSGKTSFVLSLMKCMSVFSNKILFESHEEGEKSTALQDSIKRLGLLSIDKKVMVIDESLEEMYERLDMQKSPDIIFIDSLEHSEFKNIKQVVDLRKRYPKKTFVIIGQASGSNPRTELGVSVLFIANQKIYVEGYRAFSRGRSFGSKEYFTIWEEEAAIYWNK